MAESSVPELIHKVNNLLAVIYAQTAAARSAGTLDAFAAALASIEKTAESTRAVVRAAAIDERQREEGA